MKRGREKRRSLGLLSVFREYGGVVRLGNILGFKIVLLLMICIIIIKMILKGDLLKYFFYC